MNIEYNRSEFILDLMLELLIVWTWTEFLAYSKNLENWKSSWFEYIYLCNKKAVFWYLEWFLPTDMKTPRFFNMALLKHEHISAWVWQKK